MLNLKHKDVYIQFLGFSSNPKSDDLSKELLFDEFKYAGNLYHIDQLPHGFKIEKVWGDYLLRYFDRICFRIFWIKEGNRWYNWTHEEYGEPWKEFIEHIASLPWWEKHIKETKTSPIPLTN